MVALILTILYVVFTVAMILFSIFLTVRWIWSLNLNERLSEVASEQIRMGMYQEAEWYFNRTRFLEIVWYPKNWIVWRFNKALDLMQK